MKAFTPLPIDMKTFLKNKALKETLSSLNFTAIQHLIISLQQHQQSKSTPVQSQEFFKLMTSTLKNNLFHLKGRLRSLRYSIDNSNISSELYFNCDLIIRDELCEYQLKAYHIRKSLADKFQKLKKEETTLYFTNLKSSITHSDKGSSTYLIFSISLITKIYAESKPILDSNNHTYDSSLSQSNNSNQVKLDISTNNELEFIESLDDKKIDKLLKKVELKTIDLSLLLTIKMPSMLLSTTKALQAECSLWNVVNVLGLISSITFKDNVGVIELYSLIDISQIKINIYHDKTLICDIKPRMVVLFKNFNHKLNKKYDIVLTNRAQSTLQVVGLINETEYERIMKHRYTYKQIGFSSIISLLTTNLSREVRKYVVSIRHVFKIQAELNDNHMKIPKHPHLKLFGKFLIDDGSYEAIGFCHDMTIVKMLDLTEEQLNGIDNQIRRSGSAFLYDRNYKNQIIREETWSQVNNKQFVVYGTPFVNSYGKTVPRDDLEKYIMNLEGKKDINSNIRMNYVFINGNITNEQSHDRNKENVEETPYDSLIFRPYLLISWIDVIDD